MHRSASRPWEAPPCYVCDGTRAMRPHARPELDVLAAIAAAATATAGAPTTVTVVPPQPRPVDLVVLTDPDERGRELRAFLDEAFAASGARARHAFVAEADATKGDDDDGNGGNHAAGNRGIEHAAPSAVRAALAAARPSYAADRRAFTPEWARERGLAGAFDGGAPQDNGDAARRRRALCARMGLGRCSVAQLLSALNRYFDEAAVEAAIEAT